MKLPLLGLSLAATLACGCSRPTTAAATAPASTPPQGPANIASPSALDNGLYRGFDRNDYPGEATMAAMHSTFAFTGYWLNIPPGETSNSWAGKRSLLKQQGWGFLVLANGRLDAEILKAQKHNIPAATLAQQDAAIAVAAARTEGFPAHTILFLDQEEGGRLLDEQAAYLLAWTEAVSASGFRAGVYASGQPVPDGPGQHITTIEDVRARVTSGHLHTIAMFDAQDACPPAPGCTLHPKPLAATNLENLSAAGPLVAWQYSQSPRRPNITQSCAKTYSPDGNCYAPGFPTLFLDLDAAATSDPSQGR
jgi:hypothetical protein